MVPVMLVALFAGAAFAGSDITDSVCLDESTYTLTTPFSTGIVGPQDENYDTQTPEDFVSVDGRNTIIACDENDGDVHCFRARNVDHACFVGLDIQGGFASTLTWQDMKLNYDKGLVHTLSPDGPAIIEYSRFENGEDPIHLPSSPFEGTFDATIRHVLVNEGRDDMVENDGCNDLTIEDSLLRGHTGVSMRPTGGNHYTFTNRPTLTLTNVIIELRCQAEDRAGINECAAAAGTSHGRFFKFPGSSSSCLTTGTPALGPRVDATDVVLYLSDTPAGGADDLAFRDGTYSNVTVYWAGSGSYPGPTVPAGVTVSTDIDEFEDKRLDWLEAHGCELDYSVCTWMASTTVPTFGPLGIAALAVLLGALGASPLRRGFH